MEVCGVVSAMKAFVISKLGDKKEAYNQSLRSLFFDNKFRYSMKYFKELKYSNVLPDLWSYIINPI